MAKRMESGLRNLAERAACWLGDYWRVLLTLLGVGILWVGIGLVASWQLATPREDAEDAEIVGFGHQSVKFGGTLVIVRTDEGRILELAGRRADLRHCRIGRRIPLQRQGRLYRVHPRGCPRAT